MKSIYLLLSLLFTSAYAGELYTWTDEDGNVQYSQTPPPQEIEATVKDLPFVPTIEAEVKKPITENEDAVVSNNQTPSEFQKENCQKAQNNLQMLSMDVSQLVMRSPDNPNDLKTLSEEERQQELNRTQTYLDSYCQE